MSDNRADSEEEPRNAESAGAEPKSSAEQVRKDTSYSPASEAEMKSREENPRSSEATDDPDIDEDDVTVLPGTGGPDDEGDVEVDEDDLNLGGGL